MWTYLLMVPKSVEHLVEKKQPVVDEKQEVIPGSSTWGGRLGKSIHILAVVEFEMVQLQIMILRPCLDPWTKTFGIKFSPFGDPNRLNCRLKFSSTPTFNPLLLKTHLIWTRSICELRKDQTTPHYLHVGTTTVYIPLRV